ncbi:hypothetical protein Tco_1434369, partial [Tanacetum coccineum]
VTPNHEHGVGSLLFQVFRAEDFGCECLSDSNDVPSEFSAKMEEKNKGNVKRMNIGVVIIMI